MPRLTLPNNVLLPEVEKLLSQGTEVTMKVKGRSMLPFIVGDRDSVALVKPKNLNRGDIVLAHLGDGRYVLHRIIRIDADNITLMGDGNLKGTEHCRRYDISGKVLKIVRNGYYIDVHSEAERCKARIWFMLLPVRRYLLGAYRRISNDNIK